MLTERRQRTDAKASRRKINQKMQTIIRKSVELAQNSCEVLLIIQNSVNKQWIQYSSSEASSLFFGFENAKKHLQEVEEYNNSNIHKFVSELNVDQDSYSPKPAKHLKTTEKSSVLAQNPNPKAERCALVVQSEISTDQTSLKSLDRFMGKVVLPPDKGNKASLKTQNLDENASPEFLFEDYFNES
jgi:hypothetical protein